MEKNKTLLIEFLKPHQKFFAMVNKPSLIFALLIVFALSLRVWHINAPLNQIYEQATAFHGVNARYYLEEGFLKTKFGLVAGKMMDNSYEYYTNHPPGIGLIIALSYKIFGVSEASTRLPPVFFSILTLILIYYYALKNWDKKIAIVSTLFATLFPMDAYFSKLATPLQFVSFFLIAELILYTHWTKTNQKIFILPLYAIHTIGLLFEWPTYLHPFVLLIFHWMRYKKNSKYLFYMCLISFFVFILHIIHMYILGGSLQIKELKLHIISKITGVVSSTQKQPLFVYDYTIFDWILSQVKNLLLYFGPISFTIPFLIKKRNFKSNNTLILIIASMSVPLLYTALLPASSWIDQYWMYPLTPLLALFLGYLFVDYYRSAKKRYLRIMLIVVLILQSIFSLWLLQRRHSQNQGTPVDFAILPTIQKLNITGVNIITPLYFKYPITQFYTHNIIQSNIQNDTEFIQKIMDDSYQIAIIMDYKSIKRHSPYFSQLPDELLKYWGFIPDYKTSILSQYLFENFKFKETDGVYFFFLN